MTGIAGLIVVSWLQAYPETMLLVETMRQSAGRLSALLLAPSRVRCAIWKRLYLEGSQCRALIKGCLPCATVRAKRSDIGCSQSAAQPGSGRAWAGSGRRIVGLASRGFIMMNKSKPMSHLQNTLTE